MYKHIKAIFLLTSIILSLPSCNSLVSLGASYNKGNLALDNLEQAKAGTGLFLEYGYKKMLEKNNWSKILSRSGLGINYNFKFRSNVSKYSEGADYFFHSLVGKTYYTLVKPGASGITLDAGLGIGIGRFPFHSKSSSFLISNLSFDLYLPKNDLFVISSKLNVMGDFEFQEYEVGIELGIGFHFQKY